MSFSAPCICIYTEICNIDPSRYSGVSSSWDLDPGHLSGWHLHIQVPEGHSPPLTDIHTHTLTTDSPGHSDYPTAGPWIPLLPWYHMHRHTHISKQVSLGAGSDLWSFQCLNLSQLLVPLVSPESTPQHPASFPPDCHGWTTALTTNLSKLGQTPVAQKA